MSCDYGTLWKSWNPWAHIPEQYNLGVALTAGIVASGRGDKPALHWSNHDGATRTLTFRELDRLSDRLAVSLQRLGIGFGDRVFLRLPNIPEFYIFPRSNHPDAHDRSCREHPAGDWSRYTVHSE